MRIHFFILTITSIAICCVGSTLLGQKNLKNDYHHKLEHYSNGYLPPPISQVSPHIQKQLEDLSNGYQPLINTQSSEKQLEKFANEYLPPLQQASPHIQKQLEDISKGYLPPENKSPQGIENLSNGYFLSAQKVQTNIDNKPNRYLPPIITKKPFNKNQQSNFAPLLPNRNQEKQETINHDHQPVESNYFENLIPIDLPDGYIQEVDDSVKILDQEHHHQHQHHQYHNYPNHQSTSQLNALYDQPLIMPAVNVIDRANARSFPPQTYHTKFIDKPLNFNNKYKLNHKLTKTIVRTEPNLKEVESMIEEFIRNGYFQNVLNGPEQSVNNEQKFSNNINDDINYLLPHHHDSNELDYQYVNKIPLFQQVRPTSTPSPLPTPAHQQIPILSTNDNHQNFNAFGYKNQKFHLNNPTSFNSHNFQFNSNSQKKSQAQILKSVPLSSKFYTNDLNNRKYPQLNAYNEAGIKLSPTKVTADFFAYSAPQIFQNEIDKDYYNEITPHKHYNVIFIKAPEQISRRTLNIAQKNLRNNEQTVIYLLSKKTDPSEIQETLNNIPYHRSQPLVHFIKYKTEEEALLAQQNIQEKFNNIGPNGDFINQPIVVQSFPPQPPLKLTAIPEIGKHPNSETTPKPTLSDNQTNLPITSN